MAAVGRFLPLYLGLIRCAIPLCCGAIDRNRSGRSLPFGVIRLNCLPEVTLHRLRPCRTPEQHFSTAFSGS